MRIQHFPGAQIVRHQAVVFQRTRPLGALEDFTIWNDRDVRIDQRRSPSPEPLITEMSR